MWMASLCASCARIILPRSLKTGHTKVYLRIHALLESGAVTREKVSDMAAKHNLAGSWKTYLRRFS